MSPRPAEAARRYRTMVRAVRAWVQATHPDADRLMLIQEDDAGIGEGIAAFHANTSVWSRGDAMAMPPRRRN